MNSREHSDMPPAPSYPSPNAAQMGQGTMQYYTNRQLTADELLSAELSRETSGPGINDSSSNGVHHGQSMVLGPSNAGGADMGRPSSPDQHPQQHIISFPPSQQVGVDPNHDLSYGDQSARRKRTKISRACDECRRKKVRCDATSESGVETCSNCRRLGVVCQFSRVPMKRGPSKGYIKELAERLHTLESQMQPAMVHPDMPYQPINEVSSPRAYQDFSSPMDAGGVSRKRTYSVFDGLPSSSIAPPFNNSRPQNAFDAGENPTDPFNPTIIAGSAPKPGNLFWATGNDGGLPAGLEIPDMPKQEEDMTPLDVDEGALNAYYEKVHPILPILPSSKDRLLGLLHQCGREVQEIFLYSLYTLTRVNIDRVASTFERVTSYDNAQDLLLYYTRQPAIVRSTGVNLIWLQSMLLMILDCDSRGPDNFVLKDGIPKHTLIQAAIKLGSDLAKSHGQLTPERSSDLDIDTDSNLVRRSWVSLVILARWYAVSVADPSVLGATQEIGGREDERVLGSVTEGIATYSIFLSDLLTLVTAATDHNVCQTTNWVGRVVGANLAGFLERLSQVNDFEKAPEPQENGPSHSFIKSLQNQLYWTTRLLIKRHIFLYSPLEIINSAEKVINELHEASLQSRQSTPFDLHSLALAAMTLLEASVLPEYTNDSWEALRKVEEILDYRAKRATEFPEFGDVFRTQSWDAKIRLFLEWRRTKLQENQLHDPNLGKSGSAAPPVVGPSEQRSLQHLADLAVGAEGSVAANASPPPPPSTIPSAENHNLNITSPNLAPAPHPQGRVVVDFALLTKEGYLNVFSGLIYRRSR